MNPAHGQLDHLIKRDYRMTVLPDGDAILALLSEDAREWADMFFDDPPTRDSMPLAASEIREVQNNLDEEGLTGSTE